MNNEYWFILVVFVTIAVGIVAFINKVFASRKYDPKFSAMILYGIMFFISIIYLLFKGFTEITVQNLLLSLVWGVQIYTYSLIMMIALRYLPTSTYFIGARLTSSFLLLVIGITFFGDIISNMEIVGLILGVLAMLLLFEKETKENTNYKKGIVVLIFGVLSLTLGHSITKILSFDMNSVPTLLSITFLSAFIFSFVFGYKTIKKNLVHFKPIFIINIVQAIFYMFYFVMLFYVYQLGDLGISYKVQSYSPFIPIILSAIIYKERITKKRTIAFILTILSLWFFV